MTTTWFFLSGGAQSPAYNMALDEYLMNRHGKQPILRFYSWQPPGLSIGYFQKTKGRINTEGLRRRGITLVRRPTGGLAVLHHKELTYSIIIPEDNPAMPHAIVGAYRALSQGLLEGFHQLGLHAELAIPAKKSGEHTPVCFEEASWYELVIAGKKAAGSAQMRHQGMILQHGSIPIHTDSDELFDCFIYPNAAVKAHAARIFSQKATALDRELGRTPELDEVKAAFYRGFKRGLKLNFEPFVLSAEDDMLVRRLAETKYQTDQWNNAR
ncbi:MAG: lipoate--protein ligase family protein [Sporolactobacillus sp.]